MKKICFVLPKYSRQPIGGYKIIFEYANRLVANKFSVTLIFINSNVLPKYHIPKNLKKVVSKKLTSIEPTWFELDDSIKKVDAQNTNLFELSKEFDIVFATAASTVEFVRENFSHSKQGYIIQGYENWDNTDEYLKKTYSYDMLKIVVANWLKEIVDKESTEKSVLISNPIDANAYRCFKPINKRNKYVLGMLWHDSEKKGCVYALEAIKEAKREIPDIELIMFGAYKPKFPLPSWIKFYHNASKEKTIEIYNTISLFVCATIEEGYGLTGLEAMSCGAVLVSTKYDGVNEYAKNNFNALLSPIKDSKQLKENIKKVINDDILREKLSINGINSSKYLSWDNAYIKFEKACIDYIED